jgi:hypothetical protein
VGCSVLVAGVAALKYRPIIIHYPDPAIYDQALLFASGGAPTFNSPDLDTVDLWPIVPIDNLSATVRNLSADASAGQVRVDWSWSPWGIGLPRQPIASSFVNLARAGFPGSEATVSLPFPPVVKTANRYGIFVRLVHPYDRDTENNQGEQTLDGFQTSQGRSKTFVVPVRNPMSGAATTLGAGAQENVMIEVSVPSNIPPSPPGTLISATVDVLATVDGHYMGGVTIAILFDA